ncbi:S9 family peptidase [Phenylobacterium sp.]|uniref:S9 family peptidase n=1 Tax=Phenylobacterium sp. TaxID=1871053 RepID=UPI002DE2ADC8|nr:S9 family peptidase [Phenylobacterium sp.]
MIRILTSGAAAAVCLAMLASPGTAQARRFSADDLPRIVRITDPQISPDGRSVAMVVARANMTDDRWDSELELVDIATKQVQVLTHGRLGVGSPRWSPTGDKIAFLAQDAAKKAQVFILPMTGGDARQLTHSKTAISLLAWRPDGAALAYAAPDEAPELKGEAKFEDAFEVGNNNYTERARVLPTHVWTVALADGAARRVTKGDWSLPNSLPPGGPPSQLAWTADGKGVVFVKADSPITGDSASSRLAVVDVATGGLRSITATETAQSEPTLSPDGARVAFAHPRGSIRGHISSVYVADLAGGAPTNATADLDRAVSLVGWTPDGRGLVLAGTEATHGRLWLQKLGGGVTPIPLGPLNPGGGGSVGKTGAIVFTASDATHPAELFLLPKPGAKPVQLTHLQTATDGVELGRMETVSWTSDQFQPDGVLTYPPDYVAGKKLPLVLYIHGGPTAASLETFSPIPQSLAAHGWLVFEPNYRGSDNLGDAFQAAIIKDSGAGPGRDVMAGVAALEKRGIVDESRIAVTGWSYGGYMTSWLIGNYPEVWKTAIAGAPVTDIIDQYTLSDNNTQRAWGYGPSPFVGDNLKSYWVQSPISYAWRVKAPTLIMSDVGDWRVTTTQAYKLYHALRDNKVPVSFVAYPVPGHSPADPIRARDVWRRWAAWLQTHLNDGPGGSATAAAAQ